MHEVLEVVQLNDLESNTAALSRGRAAVFLCAITVVAAILRLHLLGAQSLWIDEAASVYFAHMPWLTFLKTLWGYQGNMTLYYFLLRAWIHLGDSEFAIRSLSALFGVLAVPAIYMLGARLFDRPTGLTAASFISVHSYHIGWSREARAYSLLTLLLILTAYFLISAIESTRKEWYWYALSVTAASCFYAHIFAAFVLLAYALALASPKPCRVELRSIAITTVLFALCCAPLAAFVLLKHSDQINWIMPPTWADISGFLELLTSQGGIWLIGLYLTALALALLNLGKGVRSDREAWAVRLLVLWLVLPPLLTLAATPIKPLFHPGFMLMCVPALVMLAARGLVKLYNMANIGKVAAAAAFAAIITMSLITLRRPAKYPYTVHADWRSATEYVLSRQRSGDGVVFFIPDVYSFRYYSDRAREQHSVKTAPETLYPTSPWRELSRDELNRVTDRRERVWLIMHLVSPQPGVTGHPDEVALIESTLTDKFHLVDKRVFSGENPITVALYNRVQAVP